MEPKEPVSEIPPAILKRCFGKQAPVVPHSHRLLTAATREAKAEGSERDKKPKTKPAKKKDTQTKKPKKTKTTKKAAEPKTKTPTPKQKICSSTSSKSELATWESQPLKKHKYICMAQCWNHTFGKIAFLVPILNSSLDV